MQQLQPAASGCPGSTGSRSCCIIQLGHACHILRVACPSLLSYLSAAVGYLHGLYEFDATKDTIAEDFLILCNLAVKHDVIPPNWDWARFLTTAEGLLPYASDKSDAKEKWGGENIFTGMLMGGRRLRFTAEVVYGKSCMYGGGHDAERGKDYDEMRECVLGKWQELVQDEGMFSDVGGLQAWQRLHSKVFVSSI